METTLLQSGDFHVNDSKMTLEQHVEVRKWTNERRGCRKPLGPPHWHLKPRRGTSCSPHPSNWKGSQSWLCKYHPAAVIWLSHQLFEPIGCFTKSFGRPAVAFTEALICQDHSACVKGASRMQTFIWWPQATNLCQQGVYNVPFQMEKDILFISKENLRFFRGV